MKTESGEKYFSKIPNGLEDRTINKVLFLINIYRGESLLTSILGKPLLCLCFYYKPQPLNSGYMNSE